MKTVAEDLSAARWILYSSEFVVDVGEDVELTMSVNSFNIYEIRYLLGDINHVLKVIYDNSSFTL